MRRGGVSLGVLVLLTTLLASVPGVAVAQETPAQTSPSSTTTTIDPASSTTVPPTTSSTTVPPTTSSTTTTSTTTTTTPSVVNSGTEVTVVLCSDGETVCEVIICSEGDTPCEVITCDDGECSVPACPGGDVICEVTICSSGGIDCQTIVCDGDVTCEVVRCGTAHACPEASLSEPLVKVPRVEVVRDITFPIVGPVGYYAGFGACRDGCRREHHGIDLMTHGWKGLPVVAAHEGVVSKINPDVGNGGCSVRVEGADGWHTRYLHMNNDDPSTDNAQGGFEHCIAPGLAVGDAVDEGQLIGWVGDSGNAEGTAPHVHFEIRTPEDLPIDPFASLQQARRISFGRIDAGDPAVVAAGLSEYAYPYGADTVYVTVAVDSDPWYSGGSSGHLDGPLLITRTDGLDGVTRAEILRLAPKQITIIGDAVGVEAEQALEGLADSVRRVLTPLPNLGPHGDGIERPQPNLGDAPAPFSLLVLDGDEEAPAVDVEQPEASEPPVASPGGGSSFYPVTLNQFMAGIRGAESGGNYTHVNPISGAYGAYQFLPRYGNDYIRYATRSGVSIEDTSWPPDPQTQDALAAGVFQSHLRTYEGNWSLVATAWHCGQSCANEAVSRYGVDATPAEIDEAVGAEFGSVHGNESEYIFRAYNSTGVPGAIEWVQTMGGTTWRNDPGSPADPNYAPGVSPQAGNGGSIDPAEMRSRVEALVMAVPTLVLDVDAALDGGFDGVGGEEFGMSAYTVPEGSFDTGKLYHPTQQGYVQVPPAAAVWEAPAYDTAASTQRQNQIAPPAQPSILVVSGSQNVGPTLAFLESLAATPFMPYWR